LWYSRRASKQFLPIFLLRPLQQRIAKLRRLGGLLLPPASYGSGGGRNGISTPNCVLGRRAPVKQPVAELEVARQSSSL
jgi:hypothetical protein